MTINWKRVVIAAIWSEFLLLSIYIPSKLYAGSAHLPIAIIAMLGAMFLGGLWAVRMSESRFVLQGILVGIIANFVFYVPLFALIPIWPNMDTGALSGHVFAVVTKILGAAIGGYVGGRLRKKSAA